MATVRIRDLSNREIASTIIGTCGFSFSEKLNFIIDSVRCEYECGEDDISFEESEDGDLILVSDVPVARVFTIHPPMGR